MEAATVKASPPQLPTSQNIYFLKTFLQFELQIVIRNNYAKINQYILLMWFKPTSYMCYILVNLQKHNGGAKITC